MLLMLWRVDPTKVTPALRTGFGPNREKKYRERLLPLRASGQISGQVPLVAAPIARWTGTMSGVEVVHRGSAGEDTAIPAIEVE
jgi:hypothetical protein